MTSSDPGEWAPPAHWAEAEIATELGDTIVDDPDEVALAGLGVSTLLVLAVVVHSHGASVKEIHRLTGRSRVRVHWALHQLDRAHLIEQEPRHGDDHWTATSEGTRLGMVPYVTRLLNSARAVRGSWVLAPVLARVGTTRGPTIFSPAFKLSEINDPELLGNAIRSGTHDEQTYALTKLLALKDPGSAEVLIEVTQRRGDDEISLARKAVIALESFDSRPVEQALMTIAGQRDSIMREAAARSLGKLGVRAAQPVLCDLLTYPSEPVRVAAIRALERIAEPESAGQIAVALNDNDSEVRRHARHSLIRLGASEELRSGRRLGVFKAVDMVRARRARDHRPA